MTLHLTAARGSGDCRVKVTLQEGKEGVVRLKDEL